MGPEGTQSLCFQRPEPALAPSWCSEPWNVFDWVSPKADPKIGIQVLEVYVESMGNTNKGVGKWQGRKVAPLGCGIKRVLRVGNWGLTTLGCINHIGVLGGGCVEQAHQ